MDGSPGIASGPIGRNRCRISEHLLEMTSCDSGLELELTTSGQLQLNDGSCTSQVFPPSLCKSSDTLVGQDSVCVCGARALQSPNLLRSEPI